jgi:predicted aconitase with swiveling domain
MRMAAKCVFKGQASGEVLKGKEPLSFWGGVDPSTGIVVDVHSDLYGEKLAGRILCLPRGAGSSSGCGVLMEMVRAGTNPAAIVNIETEAVLALGPIISQELYGRSFPMVTVGNEDFGKIKTGMKMVILASAVETELQIVD